MTIAVDTKVEVTLAKPAKKSGGDRYESTDGFVIYIPQGISRPAGVPLRKLEITFKGGD